MQSYRVDIATIEESGWIPGPCRYTTRAIAEREGASLRRRWTVVTDYRVSVVREPPTHGVDANGVVRLIDDVRGVPQSLWEAKNVEKSLAGNK